MLQLPAGIGMITRLALPAWGGVALAQVSSMISKSRWMCQRWLCCERKWVPDGASSLPVKC